jgi:hypothetical protein
MSPGLKAGALGEFPGRLSPDAIYNVCRRVSEFHYMIAGRLHPR